MGDSCDMAVTVGKTEDETLRDGSMSSISSPEAEPETYTTQDNPPQKRKGGRKPVSIA
jgi:hypothetical protein